MTETSVPKGLLFTAALRLDSGHEALPSVGMLSRRGEALVVQDLPDFDSWPKQKAGIQTPGPCGSEAGTFRCVLCGLASRTCHTGATCPGSGLPPHPEPCQQL